MHKCDEVEKVLTISHCTATQSREKIDYRSRDGEEQVGCADRPSINMKIVVTHVRLTHHAKVGHTHTIM